MTGVKIAVEGLQIRLPGTVNTSITLTPENSTGIAQYSQLIGWTEADLTNCLLTEILELFADSSSGRWQAFLVGSITPTAQALSEFSRESLKLFKYGTGEFADVLPL
jgi:hypothetical protein